jgi:DNA transformation protein
MSLSPEFKEHLEDLLGGFGPVSIRSMFGGAGLFKDGLMFGLIGDETLYFKVDDENRPHFEKAGTDAFTYEGKGKAIRMSYFECPPELLEDPQEFQLWARNAFDAALRADKKKPKKKTPKKKTPKKNQ